MLILIVEVRKLIQKNLNESNGLFLHRGMLRREETEKEKKDENNSTSTYMLLVYMPTRAFWENIF